MRNYLFCPIRRGTYIAILACVLFTCFSCLKTFKEENIYGVWKGFQDSKEFVFTFNRDGTCVLQFSEEAAGKMDVLKGDYEMDFTKQPVPLTVRNLAQLSHAIHTIVEFVNTDSIKVAHFASKRRLRPLAFGSSGNLHLKKVHESAE